MPAQDRNGLALTRLDRRKFLQAGLGVALSSIALQVPGLSGGTASAQTNDLEPDDDPQKPDDKQDDKQDEDDDKKPEPAPTPPGAAIGDEIPYANGMPLKAYFPETGHHLAGEFLHHWLNNGSFTIYGFPITEELTEKGRTVQYFERARLELWPEHSGTEWVIQGTLLGNWKAERINHLPAFRPLPDSEQSTDDRWVFPETRHSLTGGFFEYWRENGAVHVFGFPISEEFEEGGYNVQYFERARMEWHPENAGTPYVVLLGHLGHEYADVNKVDKKPVAMHRDAVRYDAGVFSAQWNNVIRTHSGGWMGFVSTDAVGLRLEPKVDAPRDGVIYNRFPMTIHKLVRGEEVDGIDLWYQLEDGTYISAAYVDPLVAPEPPATYGGTWVDVNLTHFWAIAYENSTPVYAAIITAGRGDRTPKGVFEVFSRVYNETMDSATVGFPPGHPEHYYLENVMFTQYFMSGGYALHGNYWTAPASFGRFSSNGCVGLLNKDAEFFWNWLWFGSVVAIHF